MIPKGASLGYLLHALRIKKQPSLAVDTNSFGPLTKPAPQTIAWQVVCFALIGVLLASVPGDWSRSAFRNTRGDASLF